jgi:hypothetical protein
MSAEIDFGDHFRKWMGKQDMEHSDVIALLLKDPLFTVNYLKLLI